MIRSVLPTLVRLGIAVSLLFSDFGNAWLRSGLCVFLATSPAFRLAFSHRARLSPATVLRVWAGGWMIAGVLCAIGSVRSGGPVGWLGAVLSGGIIMIGAWSLSKFTPTWFAPSADRIDDGA